MSTSMIHVRIDDSIKNQATEALSAMGLSVSDAVRLLLTRVAAEKAFPFMLKVPNAETQKAMHEAETGNVISFTTAEDLFNALEKDH